MAERMSTRRGGERIPAPAVREREAAAAAKAEKAEKAERAERAEKAELDETKKEKAAGSGAHGSAPPANLTGGGASSTTLASGGAPRAKKPKLDHEDAVWGGPPPPAPRTLLPQPLLPIHKVAGRGEPGFLDGPCSVACFQGPTGITVTKDGCLLVADADNRRLRKIMPAASRDVANGGPAATAGGGHGNAALGGTRQATATKPTDGIPPTFVAVRTMAGTGQWGLREGRGATLCDPYGVVSDAEGNAFVTDAGSHTVRRVSASGEVTILAGSGKPGFADGRGSSASFDYP